MWGQYGSGATLCKGGHIRGSDVKSVRIPAKMNEADVKLSKTLSYFLRHAAGRQSKTPAVSVDSEGFASVDSILALPQMRPYTFADIERVVIMNDKQRFALVHRPDSASASKTAPEGPSGWYIRANQGHTFNVPDLDLKLISMEEAATKYGNEVVHATFAKAWPLIRGQGLSRMNREHIHFLPKLPPSEQRRQISGKLKNTDLFIFINLKKAMEDGYQFYLSANNVVLCPGDKHGMLDRKYFVRVLSGRDDKEMQEVSL